MHQPSSDHFLALPNDSVIDLKSVEQVSAPHFSEFLRLFKLMCDDLSTPSTFYNLVYFFETIAVEKYTYHVSRHKRHLSRNAAQEHELLTILVRHGLATERSETGSSSIHVTLTPKGEKLFNQVYRILKISWVCQYAKQKNTFPLPTFFTDSRITLTTFEVDSTFSEYLLRHIFPAGTTTEAESSPRDTIAEFADQHVHAAVSRLFQHLYAGDSMNTQDPDLN